MKYNKESFEKALKECKIIRWKEIFEQVVKSYLKAEEENNIVMKDYKLLEKYIKYIIDVEGSDSINIHDNRKESDVKFTKEEWDILQKVSKKSRKDTY